MATEIKLPDLGEGVESGDVLEILVQVGDTVQKGQGIIEVETDKASVAVPSKHAGVVSQIHVETGQTVKVGAALVTLEAAAPPAAPPAAPLAAVPLAPQSPAAAAYSPAVAAASSPPVAAASSPPVAAASSPPVAAASSPPVAAASSPPVAPVVARQAPPSSALVAATVPPNETIERAPAEVAADTLSVPAGPAIRRFAREVGIDLSQVLGTGEGGRITREDVLQVVRSASQKAQSSPPSAPPASPPSLQPTTSPTSPLSTPPAETQNALVDNWGSVQLEKASKIRRTIATKMHESWTTVPRVTNFDDADVTELEEMRQESKADYARQGIKLTSMPFVIKAVAMALKQHPLVNATLDLEQGHIIHKDYVNIGIAVDGGRGLVVPALRNADQLSVPQTAKELSQLVTMVQENGYGIEDLRGGTFTISNLGAIGGTYSTPIVNIPEVAILLVGRSRKLPVVIQENGKDQIVPRLMMPLSLSYDHRLVDGATAARFLNDVIAYLENPRRIVLAP